MGDRSGSPEEEEIYLQLSRLLNLYVTTAQDLYSATVTFLGSPAAKVPYLVGVADSVAVGKSTLPGPAHLRGVISP